jgi:N-acetylmuramoyl-L-alanine amidase
MIRHVVKQGECLSLIAAAYGFADWKTIYDDGANAALKKKRPNPHVLHPGDEVMIPDRDDTPVEVATGKEHRFVLKLPKRLLEVKMLDEDKLPLENERWVAVAGDVVCAGVTDGDGVLTLELPVDASRASIWIAGLTRELELGALNPVDDAPDDGVSGVQGRLLGLGFAPGPIDGVMGPRTRSAVAAFQRHYQLEITGEADAATRARLKKEYRA